MGVSLGNEQRDQITISASSGSGILLRTRFMGFTRVPFSKNGRVHVESCCDQCNLRILEWHNDFDEQERRHAAECPGRRSE